MKCIEELCIENILFSASQRAEFLLQIEGINKFTALRRATKK